MAFPTVKNPHGLKFGLMDDLLTGRVRVPESIEIAP